MIFFILEERLGGSNISLFDDHVTGCNYEADHMHVTHCSQDEEYVHDMIEDRVCESKRESEDECTDYDLESFYLSGL